MTAGHDDDEPAGVPIDAFPMPAGYHSVAEVRLYRRAYFEDAVTQLGYIPSADAMLEYVAVHRAAEAVQALQRARDWASRRCILGVLAIQRVDGPSLAMLTHPSNQSNSQGMTRPSPLPCRAGYLAGVFFATPRRVPVRAATRITRLRGRPWGGHSGMTPRSGGAAGSRIP